VSKNRVCEKEKTSMKYKLALTAALAALSILTIQPAKAEHWHGRPNVVVIGGYPRYVPAPPPPMWYTGYQPYYGWAPRPVYHTRPYGFTFVYNDRDHDRRRFDWRDRHHHKKRHRHGHGHGHHR
jgi:hypothetical protein